MREKLDVSIVIREEVLEDHARVFQLVKEAFIDEAYSDQKEQYLVERLRESDSFIPELSLVAIIDFKIIGYVLLTLAAIKNENSYIYSFKIYGYK